MSDTKDLHERLRAAGVSQEKIAVLSGVSRATITNILRGTKTPNPATVQALSVALNKIENGDVRRRHAAPTARGAPAARCGDSPARGARRGGL